MQNRTAKQVMVINPIVENESERKIRMAAYCRVSTDSDDQQNSFLAQVTYYNELIRSQENAELVDIYADANVIKGLKQNPTHGRRFSPVFFA